MGACETPRGVVWRVGVGGWRWPFKVPSVLCFMASGAVKSFYHIPAILSLLRDDWHVLGTWARG